MKNLKLLSKIALSFQNLENFNKQIQDVLESLGKLVDVSKVCVILNKCDDTDYHVFNWFNEDKPTKVENKSQMKCEDLSYLIEFIEENGHICSDNISNLPDKARQIFKSYKIRSLVVYPLVVNDSVKGIIGLEEFERNRKWKSEEIEVLNAVSAIISNAYERKLTHEDVIYSESNFRNFFETSNDMLIISDLEGNIIHCNNSLIDKLGYSLLELKNKNILELHPEHLREQATDRFDKMLKGEASCCALEVQSKQGDIHLVETRTWFGKWNKHDCIYSISTDVTEREALTKALDSKCNKLTNIIEGTKLGTWEWYVQTQDLVVNEEWAKMIGYSLDELGDTRSETWFKFAHPEDLKLSNILIEKHLKNETQFYDFEIRMKHKDGSWIWVHDRGRVTERDESGKPIKMFGTHTEITSRKKAEEALKENERRFFLALDQTKAGLWDFDIINEKIFFSPMWKKILGYSEDEVENSVEGWKKLWHPDEVEQIEQTVRDHINTKSMGYELIHRLKHKDGSWRWILSRSGLLTDDEGKPYRWIGTNIDITKEHEQSLELERIFSINLDLLCILDEEGKFIKVNGAWSNILGYSLDKIEGKNILEFIHKEDVKNTLEAIKRLKDGEKLDSFINRSISSTGKEHYLEWRGNPYEGLIYAAARDVTERIEHEKKILEISNRDALTNAYNRRYIFDKAEEIIKECKITDKTFSVCIIDIDFFKKINDNYGHQVGDCVLKGFTNTIDENLRPLDILGRYGGEEFIVILNDTNAQQGSIVIERILNIIREKTFIFNDNDIRFTFSAGISSSDELDKANLVIDHLVEIADKRMYQAKNTGRNKVIFK